MMTRIRRLLFSVRHIYLNPIDRQRASVLLFVNWTLVLAALAWLGVGVLPRLLRDQFLDMQAVFSSALICALSLVIHRFIQTGRLRQAIWLFVLMLTASILQLVVFWSDQGPSVSGAFVIAITVPMVAAGVLLNRRGMALVAMLLIGSMIYAGVTQSQSTSTVTFQPSESALIDAPIIIITLALILLFLMIFTGNLERIANESLSDVQQRQWITEFGIELGEIEDENRVLIRALEMMRDRFHYIFGQFYLTDDAGQFNRTIRYGSLQAEAATRDTLNLSDASTILEAAQKKTMVLTSSDDPVARRNHLLTSANYSVAVPIVQQDQLLGILDVQSAGQVAFSQNELQALKLLAEQVSSALAHTRAVNILRRNLNEQNTVNQRLRAQVADYTQRERRGVSTVWSQYLQGRGKAMIGYNIESDNTPTPVAANDVPETLQATLQSGELHVEQSGDEQIVNVPITFRDQTLGAMSFAVPQGQQLSERQIEMARIVAERLALALENTRLFEQSQAQALRERKASEVSSLLIGATDVHSVLNLAAQNFNEALGAIHTRIYIQPGLLSEPLAETREEEMQK
jgi:GAF domain-containing protein